MIPLIVGGLVLGAGLIEGYHWLRGHMGGAAGDLGTSYDYWQFKGIETVPKPFLRGLAKGALALGIEPNSILTEIMHESGGKTGKAAENWQGEGDKRHLVANGLIQMIRSTAQKYGLTLEELSTLDHMAQLPTVLGYFGDIGKAFPGMRDKWTPEQALRAAFYPSSVGKDPSFVIAKKDDKPANDTPEEVKRAAKSALIYTQNAGMDTDHDGLITAADSDREAARVYQPAKARGIYHV